MSDEMNEAEDMELEDELDGSEAPSDGDDLEEGGDDLFGDDEAPAESASTEEEADDDESEASRPRARKVEDEDDDDEEEEDVEADLDEILRGRMATDDDDEEDDDAAAANAGAKPGVVNARKSDEFVCGICFMVVSQKQTKLPCPMGDGLESHQPLDM